MPEDGDWNCRQNTVRFILIHTMVNSEKPVNSDQNGDSRSFRLRTNTGTKQVFSILFMMWTVRITMYICVIAQYNEASDVNVRKSSFLSVLCRKVQLFLWNFVLTGPRITHVDCVSFIKYSYVYVCECDNSANCGFIISSNNFSSLCRHWILYLGL
jgi:hypothetical protein